MDQGEEKRMGSRAQMEHIPLCTMRDMNNCVFVSFHY